VSKQTRPAAKPNAFTWHADDLARHVAHRAGFMRDAEAYEDSRPEPMTRSAVERAEADRRHAELMAMVGL
jgi:hypothetical protein